MKRLVLAAILGTTLWGVLAPGARADGGPPISMTVSGVSTPSGKTLYEARADGRRTIVVRIGRKSDRLDAARSLPLRGFGIPAIGLYHPTPVGLSADGRSLVLEHANAYGRNPTSSFAVLSAKTLRLGQVVKLRGVFGFDGISPDGRRLYLVEYPSPLRAPTHYVVRAYDLNGGRLAAKPIVDPSDDEQMRGLPVMRTTSPNGRWAYTLYTGAASGKPPFIHALDLARGKAKCIDLPLSIGGVYNDRIRLTPNARALTVVSRRNGVVAMVDTDTFQVATPALRNPASTPMSDSGSTLPWVLLALGAGLVVAAGSLWGWPRRHRRRFAGTGE